MQPKYTTPAGFLNTPSGRLKFPYPKPPKVWALGTNFCGLPLISTGDMVTITGNGIAAGTVGVALSVKEHPDYAVDVHRHSATVQYLDGKQEEEWSYFLTKLSREQVQEVIQFYVDRGRPQRVKYNPLRPADYIKAEDLTVGTCLEDENGKYVVTHVQTGPTPDWNWRLQENPDVWRAHPTCVSYSVRSDTGAMLRAVCPPVRFLSVKWP